MIERAARKAVEAFDAAHPEIIAEIRAEREAKIMEKSFTLKWDAALYQRAREEAHKRGISIAQLIREALKKYLGE